MALIGPSCLAGLTKGEEDLQLEEEEGLRPLASRGKGHRAGHRPSQSCTILKVQAPPELLAHREKARLRKRDWRPQSRASSGSQRGSFLVERAGRNK